MKHKCDGCRYKGEHQEMMFRPFGVCTRALNLIEAEKNYNAEKCPYETKALQYDREQYEKGYEDGIRDFSKKLVEHYFYDLERLAIFDEDIVNFADEMINS